MTYKHPTVRLVEILEAEEKLLVRGFTKEQCKECKGTGIDKTGSFACDDCDGLGFHWKAPIPK